MLQQRAASKRCGVRQYRRENRILSGCIDSLLPSVGNFVQKVVVSNSLVLDDAMVCWAIYFAVYKYLPVIWISFIAQHS